MDKEPTKEEIAERAQELARRVMAKPAQPQEWPKNSKPTKFRAGVSKQGKRARVGEAS